VDCVAIQTITGQEHILIQLMRRMINPGIYKEAYIPQRQVEIRRHEETILKTERLYPGYVFADTDNTESLFLALKGVPKLTRLLSDGAFCTYVLEEKEAEFIRRIGIEREDHIFGISRICTVLDKPYEKGDRVQIVSGDLKMFEGDIVGYDFHRRKARIRTPVFGGKEILVGIELIRPAGIQRNGGLHENSGDK